MSKLFGISKQTLQYYDEIGIFKPSFRDDNGYRMYCFEQSLQLAAIIYFIDKGFSLDQIRKLRQNLNIETYFDHMEEQYESLEQEISRLKEVQKATKRRIDFVKENMNIDDVEKIWIEEKPDRFYYSVGNEDVLYIHNGFYKNPTVVFYNDDEKHFACFLYGEKQNPRNEYEDVKVMTIPNGRYLCGYHLGEYNEILKKVDKIRNSHPELKLDRQSIHFNIIDQFVESDKSKFLTEINIKIL